MKRRLIVCADGTWNTQTEVSDQGVPTPTNVTKLFDAVMATAPDGVEQSSHYEPGVGTEPNFWDKWFGGGIGKGLDEHIKNCYTWLVKQYLHGDDIYLFGFSRGAYTVRSLAGMIRNAGILRPEHIGYVDEAYDLYRDRDESTHPSAPKSVSFRQEHSHTQYGTDRANKPIDSTPIRCIGVWDTVGALGIPLGIFSHLNSEKYSFHDTGLSSRVRFAFHALSIDEKRKPFAPTLWTQPREDADNNVNWLEQAWFTGAHSNVGGGCPDAGLSDQALMWMAERVTQKDVGLALDTQLLANTAKPNCFGVIDNPFQGIYVPLGEFIRKLDDVQSRKADVQTWEYAHVSAKQRFTETPAGVDPWKPVNIEAYFNRPDARAWPFRDTPAPQPENQRLA